MMDSTNPKSKPKPNPHPFVSTRGAFKVPSRVTRDKPLVCADPYTMDTEADDWCETPDEFPFDNFAFTYYQRGIGKCTYMAPTADADESNPYPMVDGCSQAATFVGAHLHVDRKSKFIEKVMICKLCEEHVPKKVLQLFDGLKEEEKEEDRNEEGNSSSDEDGNGKRGKKRRHRNHTTEDLPDYEDSSNSEKRRRMVEDLTEYEKRCGIDITIVD